MSYNATKMNLVTTGRLSRTEECVAGVGKVASAQRVAKSTILIVWTSEQRVVCVAQEGVLTKENPQEAVNASPQAIAEVK